MKSIRADVSHIEHQKVQRQRKPAGFTAALILLHMADSFLGPLGPLTMFLSTWVCLFILVWGVSSSPVIPRTDSKVAVVDDVNVLMYGVLQFSESLHHVYQNTEAKLERITRAVTDTERLVRRLDQETEQTIRSERQIKDKLDIIQAETAVLQAQAQQTRGLVHKVVREDVELKQKLSYLEATLKRFTPDRIRALQEITQKHNTLLRDLANWTEKHKQQLDHQKQQVAELQKQTDRIVYATVPQSTQNTRVNSNWENW